VHPPTPPPDGDPPPADLRRARFERLYDETSHKVLGYALRRVASRDDAADVVAETFMVAWRRLEQVPVGDDARLWLYGVARRVLANQRRGQARQARLDARLRGEIVATVAGIPDQQPGDSPVAAALARLGDRDRELLTLIGWEELDRDQVARVLGCSRAAARVRLHRARRRFAAKLAEVGEDIDIEPVPVPWAGARQDRREAL
jgi:RNA polymerase sigma factor (sigma-70 family)